MEKEKLQHYSIRKLSVGAASVLIGLSFVGLGRSTQVKADTVNDPAVTQTKENAETTNSQRIKSQQETTNPNKQSITLDNQNNGEKTNEVNAQDQKAVNNSVDFQTKDNQQVQKSQDTSLVKNNDDVTNASKQTEISQEKKQVSDVNTANTNKLNIKPDKQSVSNNAALLLAQKNVTDTNDPYLKNLPAGTRKTSVGYTHLSQDTLIAKSSKIEPDRQPGNYDVDIRYPDTGISLKLSATLNKDDVKDGNNILLATSNVWYTKNGQNTTPLPFWIMTYNHDTPVFFNNQEIGSLVITNNAADQTTSRIKDNHECDFWLHVTKTLSNLADDPSISVDLTKATDKFYPVNTPWDEDWSPVKGVKDSNNNYVQHALLGTDQLYNFHFVPTNNYAIVGQYRSQNENSSDVFYNEYENHLIINFTSHHLFDINDKSIDVTHLKPIVNGQTERVIKISNLTSDNPIKGINDASTDMWVYQLTHDGRIADDGNRYNPSLKNSVIKADNNLTATDLLNQTQANQATYSVQNNGDILVAYKINLDQVKIPQAELNSRFNAFNNDYLNQVYDPEHASENMEYTRKTWTENPYMPFSTNIYLTFDRSKPAAFSVADVTPSSDSNADPAIKTQIFNSLSNTSSFNAELYRNTNVNYVDDDTGKNISNDSITGRKENATEYTINVPTNYVLSPNNTDGTNYKWSNDKKTIAYTFADDQKQNDSNPIVIHLTHGRKDIVDTNTISETIHYQFEDGSKAADDYNAKSLASSRLGHKDLVTGQTIWDSDWSQETFPEVNTPHINGYTADIAQIAAQTVDGTSQDIVKTVIYKANNQKIFVHYIDDDVNGQDLHTDPLVGKSNTTANYTTGDAIKNYLNQGYDLVSDDTQGKALRYDADDEHDQAYNVHLKHHISDVTDPKMLNATFDRVITETLPDGKQKQITQHYVITRTGKQDQVTKKYAFTNWSSAQVHEDKSDTFDGYTAKIASQSPEAIALIKAGVPTVKAETFTNANNNSTQPVNISENVVITYDANDQKVQINYIDDTLNSTLHSDNLVGKSNTDANYTTASAIRNYLSQGYDLVNDDTQGNPIIFDAHDEVDQVYNVHLKHHISDVTDSKMLNATFDRVVVETLPDGQTKQFKQHYVITRTGKQDQVTKKYAFTNWSSAQVHEDKGDALDGYTAKINSANIDGIALVDDSGVPTVKAEKFTNENNNSTTPVNVEERVEVGYLPNDQKATITFIDDDAQKDKQILQTQNLVGKSNTKSSYDTGADIENYLSKGFELVSDDTKGNPITFDAHDKVDQVFTVHLKHHISDVTDPRVLTATFDRVITEHTPDGKDKQITQHYVITRTGKQDQVTKKYAWSDWTTVQVHEDKGDTFEGYTPHLSGNNLDSFISLVNGTPIAKAEVFTNENGKLLPKNISEKVDITYTANPQEAAIVFYDDTADTPLQKNTVRGHYGEAIEFTPKVSDVITEYTKKGYVLVSNEFDNQKYAADDKQNVFVVHLKHGTVDVTRSKDVTETIHYIYDNDSKAHDDYVATKQFVNHGTKDLVTGNIVWQNAWTPANDEFAQVNSPEIPGYTPDKSSIPAQKVNVDSKNLEFTVKYSAIPAEPSSSNDPEPSNPVPEKPIETTPDTPVSTPDDNISKEESSKPKKHEPAIKKASRTHSTPVIDHFAAPKKVAEIKPGMERKAQAASIEKSSTVSEPRAKELPTTGEKDEDQLGYVGLALASLVGIFGYSIKKRED